MDSISFGADVMLTAAGCNIIMQMYKLSEIFSALLLSFTKYLSFWSVGTFH